MLCIIIYSIIIFIKQEFNCSGATRLLVCSARSYKVYNTKYNEAIIVRGIIFNLEPGKSCRYRVSYYGFLKIKL